MRWELMHDAASMLASLDDDDLVTVPPNVRAWLHAALAQFEQLIEQPLLQ